MAKYPIGYEINYNISTFKKEKNLILSIKYSLKNL